MTQLKSLLVMSARGSHENNQEVVKMSFFNSFNNKSEELYHTISESTELSLHVYHPNMSVVQVLTK